MSIRILFVGTDKFAVPALDRLIQAPGYEVVGVITQPDRPVGRKKIITAPDLKQFLVEQASSIPTYQPEKLGREAETILKETEPDLIIVAAYGQMIPELMINYPRYKCLNIHGSLLPMYRGAVPIEMALLNGDKTTGVSILQMTPGLDDGPVLAEAEVKIQPEEDAIALRSRLAQLGAELLYDILPNWIGGSLKAKDQKTLGAETNRVLSVCRTADLSYDKAQILSTDSVEVAMNKVRAFSGSGYAWVNVIYKEQSTPVKIISAKVLPEEQLPSSNAVSLDIGKFIYENKQLLWNCPDGRLLITRLQLPGKNPITGKEAGFFRSED